MQLDATGPATAPPGAAPPKALPPSPPPPLSRTGRSAAAATALRGRAAQAANPESQTLTMARTNLREAQQWESAAKARMEKTRAEVVVTQSNLTQVSQKSGPLQEVKVAQAGLTRAQAKLDEAGAELEVAKVQVEYDKILVDRTSEWEKIRIAKLKGESVNTTKATQLDKPLTEKRTAKTQADKEWTTARKKLEQTEVAYAKEIDKLIEESTNESKKLGLFVPDEVKKALKAVDRAKAELSWVQRRSSKVEIAIHDKEEDLRYFNDREVQLQVALEFPDNENLTKILAYLVETRYRVGDSEEELSHLNNEYNNGLQPQEKRARIAYTEAIQALNAALAQSNINVTIPSDVNYIQSEDPTNIIGQPLGGGTSVVGTVVCQDSKTVVLVRADFNLNTNQSSRTIVINWHELVHLFDSRTYHPKYCENKNNGTPSLDEPYKGRIADEMRLFSELAAHAVNLELINRRQFKVNPLPLARIQAIPSEEEQGLQTDIARSQKAILDYLVELRIIFIAKVEAYKLRIATLENYLKSTGFQKLKPEEKEKERTKINQSLATLRKSLDSAHDDLNKLTQAKTLGDKVRVVDDIRDSLGLKRMTEFLTPQFVRDAEKETGLKLPMDWVPLDK